MILIIDTDGGIDDAVALLMVTAHPTAELLAITTVMGNVSLEQATHNVNVVLDSVGAPGIPLFRGCPNPLLQYAPINAVVVHGSDGLGNAAAVTTDRNVQEEHASLALNRLGNQQLGEITLLTLGPLTYVALAVRLVPSFLDKLKHLVIMGGSVDGRGNTTAAAEFNILVDPEAASLVFEACQAKSIPVSLLSWETTLAHPVPLATWEALIAGDSPAKALLQQMTSFFRQLWRGAGTVLWPDPLAAAVALEPDIIEATEVRHLSVNTKAGLSREATVVDYRLTGGSVPYTNVVRRVNQKRFEQLLEMAALQ
jgi:purine nucleosidase